MKCVKFFLLLFGILFIVINFSNASFLPCSKTIEKFTHTDSIFFAIIVTHLTHDMTLQDLRYYFKPDAKVLNGIPTANRFSSKKGYLLHHAPSIEYDENISTVELKVMDMFLSKWGAFKTQFNFVEDDLIHQMHMHDMYDKVKEYYNIFNKTSIPRDVCNCMTAVNRNGIALFQAGTAMGMGYAKSNYLKSISKNKTGKPNLLNFILPKEYAANMDNMAKIFLNPSTSLASKFSFFDNLTKKNELPQYIYGRAAFMYCILHNDH